MSTSKMVTLRSSDGGYFDAEEVVALQPLTIKHTIEDNCADNGIPSPNVTSNTWAKVLAHCKKHVDDIPKKDDGSCRYDQGKYTSGDSKTSPDGASFDVEEVVSL
ncbi:hypothetical protein C5167_051061 [Papaver somniferum]|uniref:SKP1 component POZ domain-containing protein n=1 Tax=Papaver somniferum TaxID=3469 RepID=A0A4Y7KQE6_PAPSO|nr:hypothetical protein C5167_051061 [Papaver somniferum]